MPTDQIFKELLLAFFQDFLRLFFPAIAPAIDPTSLVQRSPEVFTDLPGGRLRRADLVIEAQTTDATHPMVLFHTEVQAERDETMPSRIWHYNTSLESRSALPVLSIVVTLHGGTAGISLEVASRTLFGTTYPRLAYWQVGLRDLDAVAYLQSELPLATALAALMRPGTLGRPGLKIALIRRVQASTIDRARLSLIVNVIESYLRLDADELRAFREQLRVEGDESVEATELTWAEEMIQQGIVQGREQGIVQGREQGIVQGREQGIVQGREQGSVDAKREVALLQIQVRFGPPDAALRIRIVAADGPALDRLLEQLPTSTALDQLLTALG